ncbi:serine/threonine-protein phosphatase [Microbulbifer salipaludis]|uniref:Serine/threonine-protein phosphatase n=1 Tax=Microbulbifer salipaludis TaxID=187980 RepID=A0ABS3EA75_9GAMM|nr:ATP-binding SpoIIE family protein phosphatase [Microbulbifer salipaludis]MBN8431969.1 serine/threonine-protein phosphatase [Microbulbifer salipaludis]
MPSFRVLIVESDTCEMAELCQLIESWEYASSSGDTLPASLHTSHSVLAALDAYNEVQPHLVIFGPQAAATATAAEIRRLRQSGGVEPVPILFVQDLTGLESSPAPPTLCDDILTKPYSLPLVQLKLASIRRFGEFNRSLMAQRDRLRRHHADFLQEQASAREIFGNLGNESCLDDTPGIRYHLSPRAVLNGDLLAATHTPDGKLVLMLGDFSGHGLAAAVGAVPLTSIFYSMIPRGFAMSRVLREINRKLYSILPRQMFCCLAMLELDPRRQHLRLLNAGMPSPCLKRSSGELYMLESRHLPLGVLSSDQIDTAIVNVRVRPGDRLFLWSDGIHEARNSQGEHFGESRLLNLLREDNGDDAQSFDRILVAVNAHAAEQHDDLSLVELDLTHPSLRKTDLPALGNGEGRKGGRVGEWSIQLTLSHEELRTTDPLPHLLSVLVQMPGAVRFQEDLAIALGELFRNALEHGVLELDSAIKSTDEGFVHYYDLMAQRRGQLDEGWVRISLSSSEGDSGGELTLVVEDSGSGFPEVREAAGAYAGRGLKLLQTVCEEVRFEPGSSRIEATIRWGKGPVRGDAGKTRGNAMQNPPLPV